MTSTAIKVGVIAEQTGPLSFMGLADANVAKMVVDDINTNGGLLGRHVQLYLEDSATIDSVAAAKATKLVEHDKVAALDHAKISEGPGGPAEMVPGQHHVRMNMYIAQATGGRFKVVKSLGMIEPKEQVVPGCVPSVLHAAE